MPKQEKIVFSTYQFPDLQPQQNLTQSSPVAMERSVIAIRCSALLAVHMALTS